MEREKENKVVAASRATYHVSRTTLLCASLIVSSLICFPAYAGFKLEQSKALPKSHLKEKSPISSGEPVLLTASEVDYDRENDVVYATGNVEIIQGDTIVLADQVIYDRPHDQVQAMGHVSALEPSGNVYFAETLEFEDDMKSGIIHQFKARLPDDSVAVASTAHKIDENVTELFKAAYTPCKCTDEEGHPKAPMWEIKADHVVIDNEAKEMTYENAYLEVNDSFPVMYTPYFSHSTPGAENQSGLLPPSFLESRNLGSTFKQPVYYTIAPDKDITLTPIYATKAGPILEGDYREMFDAGLFDLKGSITNAPNTDSLGNWEAGHEVRGNIDTTGLFRITDQFDWGFNINRASDDTYLHLYHFNNDALLTSRVYAEGYNFVGDTDRNYASISALSFQGLTGLDNASVIPVVAPLANFTWQSQPGLYNSRVTFEGNSMVLLRDTGDESRRLSGTARLKLPYITDDGQILEVEGQMRTDVYDVSDVQLPGGDRFSGVTGREVPQLSATWRYPFINRIDTSSVTLEPIVNAVVSPGGGNPAKIPNEDSLLPDFSDANLFSADRFAGLDRIETGPRMSYGVRGQAQVFTDKYIDGVVGQQYRVTNDPNFPIANDPTSHFSDYVGKIGLTYQPFNLNYRLRLDKDDLAINRTEIDAGYNLYPVNLATSYLSLKDDPVLGTREVLTGNASLNLTHEWSVVGSGSRDMLLDQTVNVQGGLAYKNECVNFTTMVGKDYTNLLDIKPALSVWFRISLKNLE